MTYPHVNAPLLAAKDRYDEIDIAMYDFLRALQEDLSGPFDHHEDERALEAFSDQWARILNNELMAEQRNDLVFLIVHLYRGELVLERRWMGLRGHSSEILRHRFTLLRSEPLTAECASVNSLTNLLYLLYPQMVIAGEEEPTDLAQMQREIKLPPHRVRTLALTNEELAQHALSVLTRLTGQGTLDGTPAFGQMLFSTMGFELVHTHPNIARRAESGLIHSPFEF